MPANHILTAYDRHMDELSTALSEEAWERLAEVQNELETLQQQFDMLDRVEKQKPDVQERLQRILQKQQRLTALVVQSKQHAAENIRKLKSAKTQQQGYLNRTSGAVPPVLYDHKE